MLRGILASVILALTLVSASNAADRVAFLVGNSAYAHAAPLINPRNDVALMADSLQELGFEVTVVTDQTRRQVSQALSRFAKKHQAADIALFYFAGHGMQFEGQNFLLGVDANPQSKFDVDAGSVRLDNITKLLSQTAKSSLVFVDACRDNPLSDKFYTQIFSPTRAVFSRGLAPLRQNTNGAMVMFAASPGQLAYDGEGNSPFARSLAEHILTNDVEILTLMKRVIRDVTVETSGAQSPSLINDIADEIYLASSQRDVSVQNVPQTHRAMFEAAKSVNTIRAWDIFARQFPNSPLADAARFEREQLTRLLQIPNTATSAQSDEVLNLSEQDAKLVQTRLSVLGYDIGLIDGVLGSATRKAVADFQSAVQLPSTGLVTGPTARAMKIELDGFESERQQIASSGNARKYSTDEIREVDDDPRLLKAVPRLRRYEFLHGYHQGHLYIAVLVWGGPMQDHHNMADRMGGYIARLDSAGERWFAQLLIQEDIRFNNRCFSGSCLNDEWARDAIIIEIE